MNVIGFREAQCKNCYKCVRTCDVKAIVVKDDHAQIVSDKCILCGHCLEACPQNAKTLLSDLDKVKEYIKSGRKTILSIAPSYLGIMKYKKPGQVVDALMRLGFFQVRETAEGAVYVTNEYERLLQEGNMENIITTCCPSVNDLIEIYYPTLTQYMAPVVSPMIAHGMMLRKEFGSEARLVFLGPCIAKKREAEGDFRTKGYIDAVINFSELEEWLEEEQIDIMNCEDIKPHNPNPEVNRLYPISSGILTSIVATEQKADRYRKFYVHGIKNCIELFESMQKGEVSDCFIEVNLCSGGCIKGPAVERDFISRFKVKLDMEESIEKIPPSEEDYPRSSEITFEKHFLDRSPNEAMPTEEEIIKILKNTGKTDKSQELNCGACGYATCREKAVAVFQGKAELNMCLPYMQEKAQSMSNVVLDTSPNIILIVDSNMKIVEFNVSAEKKFRISKAKAKEKYLYELFDHSDFEEVLQTRKNILGRKMVLPDWNLNLLANIVYVNEQNGVLGIFQDISKEEEKLRQEYKVKVETIEMAQKVIDKQMMVAQQIAGLLGETTAETKVTLTKLRDTILYDGEEQTKR